MSRGTVAVGECPFSAGQCADHVSVKVIRRLIELELKAKGEAVTKSAREIVHNVSSALKPKKLGRPPKPEGRAVLVAGRVTPATAAAVDAYATKNAINRSEAVRELIERALKGKHLGSERYS